MNSPSKDPSSNSPPDGESEPPTPTPTKTPTSTPTQVVQNASPAELVRFVSTIKNAEQQVGEHIIKALQHNDTVAVLTSVVLGADGQQHIVSAAIDPARMQQINALLQSAVEEREEEEMCIGFHCLIKPKRR